MKLQRIDFVMRQQVQEAETFWQIFVEFLIMLVALLAVPYMFFSLWGAYVTGG